MKKINYHKQEQDLIDRLLRLIESGSNSRLQPKQTAREVTEPATREQLEVLGGLGIRPKWAATRHEAHEMISHYKLILNSVNRGQMVDDEFVPTIAPKRSREDYRQFTRRYNTECI